jgi:hypothetical protein
LGFDNRNPLRQETFDLSPHPIPAPAGSFNPYPIPSDRIPL